MIHTKKVTRKLDQMLAAARRLKLAKQAASIWDDLPPATKGEILLKKWEDESILR